MGKTIILFVFGLVFLIGLAWWAGTNAGEFLSASGRKRYLQQRKQMQDHFVNRNTVVQAGKKWPDVLLQNLDGDWVSFSEIVHDTTLIVYIEPSCESCESELDELSNILSDKDESHKVILVSGGFPLDLAQIRKARNIFSTILIDNARELFQQMDGVIYPLNVIVTGDLEIVTVLPGKLGADELSFIEN